MPTNYTTLLGFAQPTTGELAGLWGDTVNNQITALVEEAIAGAATASVTSGDWTLTTTGSGASNQARCAILIPTGTPGTGRNIIAPKRSKAYLVVNKSNGAVTVKGFDTTGVAIAAGAKEVVAWDGSDFVSTRTVVGGNSTFTQVNITGQGDLRLEDNSGGEYAGLQAPSTVSSSYVLTMPTGPGTANQALVTNGSNELSWLSFLAKTNPVIEGSITEEVYALTGTTPVLEPDNGTIQTWTLSANSAPTDGIADGQSITLMIADGSAYSITWPTMTWVGGSAPDLATSGYTVIVLWKVGATLYGVKTGEVT